MCGVGWMGWRCIPATPGALYPYRGLGAGGLFDEEMEVIEDTCCKRGDAFCAFTVRKLNVVVDDQQDLNTQSIQSLAVDTDRSFHGHEKVADADIDLESVLDTGEEKIPEEGDFSYMGTLVFEESESSENESPESGRNDWQSLLPTLVGRYRVLAPIGEGGMGVVFKGVDEELGRMVAIKTLKDTGYNKSYYDLFLAEARQLARLNHPSVVTIHDVGRIGKRPFFVMEWLNGVTLAERMRKAPIKQESARELFLQLLDALNAVHKMGIVHRDVKPANVMLSAAAKTCCLLDFGLASTDGQRERKGVSGTPGYFAPEVLKGLPGDYRSDFFSLGAIAYEMFSGVPMSRLKRLHQENNLSLQVLEDSESWKNLNENARTTIQSMLLPDPDNRLCDAERIAAGFEFDTVQEGF